MIDACDGSVMGATAKARVNTAPSRARPSMVGVCAAAWPYAPIRSARSVSIVKRIRLRARPGGAGVEALLQAADTRAKMMGMMIRTRSA